MLAIPKRPLPRQQLSLTAIGLGCAQMGNLYRVTPQAEAQGAFDAAWQAGIRYFDTAPYYGHTRSERRLGTMLTDHPRSEYTISTKVGRVLVPDGSLGPEENGFIAPLPFRPVFDYTHDGIMRSFEDSCQRLGIIDPDIIYVHDIGGMQHGAAHFHYWDQITTGGGFRALERLRSEGAVRAVGLGVNEWQVIRDAMQHLDLDIAMLAGRYTLLEQESLGFLDHCLREGMAIAAAGVFNSGILAGNRKFNYAEAPEALLQTVARIEAVCARHGVSLQAAAIQFVLAHPAVATVVLGARNAAQVTDNVARCNETIPDAFWSDIREQGLVAEGAPLPGTGA